MTKCGILGEIPVILGQGSLRCPLVKARHYKLPSRAFSAFLPYALLNYDKVVSLEPSQHAYNHCVHRMFVEGATSSIEQLPMEYLRVQFQDPCCFSYIQLTFKMHQARADQSYMLMIPLYLNLQKKFPQVTSHKSQKVANQSTLFPICVSRIATNTHFIETEMLLTTYQNF